MWQYQVGCFEMFIAYYIEKNGRKAKTYREFLLEIILAHERETRRKHHTNGNSEPILQTDADAEAKGFRVTCEGRDEERLVAFQKSFAATAVKNAAQNGSKISSSTTSCAVAAPSACQGIGVDVKFCREANGPSDSPLHDFSSKKLSSENVCMPSAQFPAELDVKVETDDAGTASTELAEDSFPQVEGLTCEEDGGDGEAVNDEDVDDCIEVTPEGQQCGSFAATSRIDPMNYETNGILWNSLQYNLGIIDSSSAPCEVIDMISNGEFLEDVSTSVSSDRYSAERSAPCQRLKSSGVTGALLCPHCAASFDRTADLNQHRFVCTLNPQTLQGSAVGIGSDSQSFRTCMTRQAPSVKGEKVFPYKCSFCDRQFRHIHGKLTHEKCHGNTRPFSCSFCLKSFTDASNMRVHERSHLGIRPFACSFCPKTFTTKANKMTHERIHTKEKPHSCSVCGKSFIQLRNKKNHELTHRKQENGVR